MLPSIRMLPTDILYTLCDYLSYNDYLSYSMTIFAPVLKISRRKRFQYCSDNIQLYPLKKGWCSDVTCSHQKMSCIELEPVLQSHTLSNYCAVHTRHYYRVDSILELIQV